MSLQSMPILDRLHPGARLTTPYFYEGSDEKAVHIMDLNGFGELSRFRRFKLGRGDRVYGEDWSDHGKPLNMSRRFGHLSLPFPRVWIEWENMRYQSPDEPIPTVWQAAMCLNRDEARDMTKRFPLPGVDPETAMTEKSWMMFGFFLVGGRPTLLSSALVIHVGDSGMIEKVEVADPDIGSRPTGELLAQKVHLFWDALVAIGWLNCRNVRTEQHDRTNNVKRRRRPNRDRAATLDFHTIHLPGGGSTEHDGPGPGEPTNHRQHMVRGHFKTFTEDAPLMGKHTGTYWWGWQVRGDKKNGVSVTDYSVANPAA